jgi:hypothetical protein
MIASSPCPAIGRRLKCTYTRSGPVAAIERKPNGSGTTPQPSSTRVGDGLDPRFHKQGPQRIVLAHHGMMRLDSTPGVGTTVMVWGPVAAGAGR